MKHLLVETVQRHVNLDAEEQRQLMKAFSHHYRKCAVKQSQTRSRLNSSRC
jgi:hypothetical protein